MPIVGEESQKKWKSESGGVVAFEMEVVDKNLHLCPYFWLMGTVFDC